MAALSVHEIYTRHIKPLAKRDRLRLLALVVQDLEDETSTKDDGKRSLLEFHGIAPDLWEGVDAQEFVNRLRAEWDHRP